MKKQIASLAVILLAVSSLAFNGCGAEEEIDQGDPGVPSEELGADPDGGDLGEEGSDPEGSNPEGSNP